MKSFTIPAMAALALAAAALGFAGTVPLNQCTVDAVRPGQTFARMDSGAPGAMDDIVTTVTATTVYVDVSC